MVTIQDLIAVGKGAGIFDFFLPFILTFAVIYGLLMRSKIFGESSTQPGKTVNVIISISIAAFVMIFTPVGTTLTNFFATFFSETLIVVLSLLGFAAVMYVVMSIAQPGQTWNFPKLAGVFIIGALLLSVGMFFSSGGAAFFPGLPELGFRLSIPSAETLSVLIVAALVAVIVWWATR